jgi:hypothetical protein
VKGYQLAQFNVAKMVAPIESQVMADFVADLDRINALAEKSVGFVWRLKDADNNATSLKVFEDDLILINMSVWETKESLFHFTYHSEHVDIFRRRKAWFQRMTDLHLALWFIPEGHRPTVEEAKQRLQYFVHNGETPYFFRFNGDYTYSEAGN